MGATSKLLSGGRPQVTLTNIIANGNFNGITGWDSVASTLATSDNVLIVTGNGTTKYPGTRQTTITPIVISDIIFGDIMARVTNSSCLRINVWLDGSTGGSDALIGTVIGPEINTWYSISGAQAIGADFSGNIRIFIESAYADASTANGKVMELKKALSMDLTDVFSAGLEPTATQISRWLDIFSNGWFDTTKAIPRRIY